MGKNPKEVWDAFAKFVPTLNTLQQKSQSICRAPQSKEDESVQFWSKVGTNLLKLAEEIESQYEVRNT